MPGTVDSDRDSILLADRDCEGAAVEGPPSRLQHLRAYSESREAGLPCCQSGRDTGKNLMNGENTAWVPPTAGSGGGEKASLKRQCRKTGQEIPQHTETNPFLYILIPPELLTMPPAGSCHLGSGMCPIPIPSQTRTVQLGDRAFHWQCRVLHPWEWVQCCCSASAEPSAKPT